MSNLNSVPISGSPGLTKLYRNDGADSFTDVSASFLNLIYSAVSWADCDGDGDLDLMITGYDSAPRTRIYRNDNPLSANSAAAR